MKTDMQPLTQKEIPPNSDAPPPSYEELVSVSAGGVAPVRDTVVTVNAAPEVSPISSAVVDNSRFFMCALCNRQFVTKTAGYIYRCPHCAQISTVDKAAARRKGLIYLVLGLLLLAVAIASYTAAIIMLTSGGGGHHVIIFGGLFASASLLRGSYNFYHLKVSQPVTSTANV